MRDGTKKAERICSDNRNSSLFNRDEKAANTSGGILMGGGGSMITAANGQGLNTFDDPKGIWGNIGRLQANPPEFMPYQAIQPLQYLPHLPIAMPQSNAAQHVWMMPPPMNYYENNYSVWAPPQPHPAVVGYKEKVRKIKTYDTIYRLHKAQKEKQKRAQKRNVELHMKSNEALYTNRVWVRKSPQPSNFNHNDIASRKRKLPNSGSDANGGVAEEIQRLKRLRKDAESSCHLVILPN